MDTTVSRRGLLLGLAAASTAAAGIQAAEAAPEENPKLLALAAELPAIAAAYHEVNNAYQAAYKEWDAHTPWAPDEMTVPGEGWPHDVPNQPGATEMQLLGGYLWRRGDKFPRRIVVNSWEVHWQICTARRAKRKAKKSGSLADLTEAEAKITKLKKLLSLAEAYEKEFTDLKREASAWHKKAYAEKDAKHEALEKHVAAIMNEPDFTMEGLLIKAQALAEWNKCGKGFGDRFAFRHGQNWHGQIADSILHHAGGDVSG